jgi:hypothetical protein
VDSPPQTAASPQPRFRRLLSFGDVLDESMRLFRQHWSTFALVSSVSLLPPGLLLIWMSGSGLIYRSFSMADLQTGRLSDPTSPASALSDSGLLTVYATLAVYVVVYSFFGVLWTAAIVVTTDTYVRGAQPALGRVYRRATRRYLPMLLSSLLFGLLLFGLTLLATGLFVVTGFGIGGSVVAAIALLFWWLRPSSRRTWLKWFIILTAPFGLTFYTASKGAFFAAASVLEGKGPVAALRRSYELTQGHWFRVFAILTVAGMIEYVMVQVLSGFVTIPLTVVDLFRGQFGLSPPEAAIASAVTVAVQILLASIGSIVYTLVFVDVRNRREGTDILERVSQLEASARPADG